MSLRRYELRSLVTQEEYQRLEREASARGCTLAKTIRDCINEYLHLREELATATAPAGKAGEPHTGKIIHTLLARSEERMAASMDQMNDKVAQLESQNKQLLNMLSQHHHDMLLHLPTVPKELHESAKASAKRRHEKWLKKFD